MIKQRQRPSWPAEIPGGATALDRRTTIALAALDRLRKCAPHEHAALVSTALRFGETWVVKATVTGEEDRWLTKQEAAIFAGVKPDTIRAWVKRGHIRHYPLGYSQREIQEYLAARGDTPSGEVAA